MTTCLNCSNKINKEEIYLVLEMKIKKLFGRIRVV